MQTIAANADASRTAGLFEARRSLPSATRKPTAGSRSARNDNVLGDANANPHARVAQQTQTQPGSRAAGLRPAPDFVFRAKRPRYLFRTPLGPRGRAVEESLSAAQAQSAANNAQSTPTNRNSPSSTPPTPPPSKESSPRSKRRSSACSPKASRRMRARASSAKFTVNWIRASAQIRNSPRNCVTPSAPVRSTTATSAPSSRCSQDAPARPSPA